MCAGVDRTNPAQPLEGDHRVQGTAHRVPSPGAAGSAAAAAGYIPPPTRKDNDLTSKLRLQPAVREALYAQCEADVALLRSLHIMDYSLLLGIHYPASPPSLPSPQRRLTGPLVFTGELDGANHAVYHVRRRRAPLNLAPLLCDPCVKEAMVRWGCKSCLREVGVTLALHAAPRSIARDETRLW